MFIARGKLSKVPQSNVLLYLDIHPTWYLNTSFTLFTDHLLKTAEKKMHLKKFQTVFMESVSNDFSLWYGPYRSLLLFKLWKGFIFEKGAPLTFG